MTQHEVSDTIHVGNCPVCNAYPVQFIAAPGKAVAYKFIEPRASGEQPAAPGVVEIAQIAYDFLLGAGFDMDSAPLNKIRDAALAQPKPDAGGEG